MEKPDKKENSFFIITDDVNRTFNIVGPMIQDSDLIDSICDLQREGREINCIREKAESGKELLIAQYERNLSYSYSSNSILTPKNFSPDFNT